MFNYNTDDRRKLSNDKKEKVNNFMALRNNNSTANLKIETLEDELAVQYGNLNQKIIEKQNDNSISQYKSQKRIPLKNFHRVKYDNEKPNQTNSNGDTKLNTDLDVAYLNEGEARPFES